ncbi:MAG: hypothetical protein IT168_10395 [Bryobacterales bacterium]|nr:hypothetical protein [Bryobacterales bacterium]
MKYVLTLALAATSAWAAADFTTGQAARLVIGQRTFTAQDPGTAKEVLGGVSGIAYANDTLFVVDSNRLGIDPQNHRILIYRNISSAFPAPTAEIPPNAGRCPVCVGIADVVLGQPDFTTKDLKAASDKTLRAPMGIATDGTTIAVADTDNNRILIWSTIPQTNQAAANVVLGQANFTSVAPNEGHRDVPSNRSMRAPQGVWIQNRKLFVADTGNNRILIWNSIPTSNFQPADVVIGQPNFNTTVQTDLTQLTIQADQKNLYTPVSVTSDGVRMYVSDLAFNRVMIWNTIPTSNNTAADVVLGQPDFTQSTYNNSSKMCASNGTDSNNNPTYPESCLSTLGFPRFALSDGKRLFVSDGGNDRILIWNTIPTTNGVPADTVLGQITATINLVSDSADPRGVASSGAVRTPVGLAFDGQNLYATDPFNRRVLVFTMAERQVPNSGVRNAASREVFAVGALTFSGEVKENQEVVVKIADAREYKYKAVKDDTFEKVIRGVVAAINAGSGDPDVLATPNLSRLMIILTARKSGEEGNSVTVSVAVNNDASLVVSTTGATLAGGQDAAKIAPGTIVSIFAAPDQTLSEGTASAPADAEQLPDELAGVQVYFDGIRAPLFSVSPTEIRAQIPWEVLDTESINAYVRTRRNSGEVTVTAAVSVPIVLFNPGIFAVEGQADPRPALAFHGSSKATGTVSVDGSVRAGDVATVTIEDRPYQYTVQTGDTLNSIALKLIDLINADPKVEAYPAAAFLFSGSTTRIRLRARQPGPDGNDIPYTASSRTDDQVILTATTPALCCANSGPVTEQNPANPGETIVVYATGLGLVKPEEGKQGQNTGQIYTGPELNDPVEFVSALAGGKTANILSAGMRPGSIGLFEIALELNSDLPTDPAMQVTIAQDVYVSNIVSVPIVNLNPPSTQ